MAKYNDTKFYWLQLKEDFFEDDAIQWLEEQKPNGRDYAYFYLKLCLKSLKSNGVLIRKVGNILIPYDNRKLAELTRIDFDTVTVAMELLKQIGLVKILDNGEIYIEQLQELIGSKSIGAFKKQQQRLISGQKVDICPPKIEIEKEIELKVDKEIKKEEPPVSKPKKQKYGEYKHVLLSDDEKTKLLELFSSDESISDPYEFMNKCIQYLDEYIEMKGAKYKSHYLAIRKWVINAVKEKSNKAPKSNGSYTLKNGVETSNPFIAMLED